MKKSLILLFLFTSIMANAQAVNKAIEQQYKTYNQLIIDRKIDAALNFTNPEMFKIVPREQMVAAMEAIFENPQIDLKSLMPTVSHFEPVKKINGVNYVKFKSHTNLEMKFKPDADAKTDEDIMIGREMMQAALEQKFGKENVSFNQSTGFFKLKTNKAVVASSADLKDWKFVIVDNPKMKSTLAGFIPAELLE